ncbi:hypothetical protein Tco_0753347 [Tanacetum coccineum]
MVVGVKAMLVVVVWVKEVMVVVKEVVGGVKPMKTKCKAMKDDEIKNYLEHKYIEEILLQEEEKREAQQKAEQDLFNEEALRLGDYNGEENGMSISNGSADKGKKVAKPSLEQQEASHEPKTKNKKKGSKRKAPTASEQLPFRIYHKNRGILKRIFN